MDVYVPEDDKDKANADGEPSKERLYEGLLRRVRQSDVRDRDHSRHLAEHDTDVHGAPQLFPDLQTGYVVG